MTKSIRNPKDYAEALKIIDDYRDLCKFFEAEIEDLNDVIAELKHIIDSLRVDQLIVYKALVDQCLI